MEKKTDPYEKVRVENQRTAARVEEGTAYHEPVTVWFTDRKEHTVEVHAISGKQFREAAKKAGINIGDLMEEKKDEWGKPILGPDREPIKEVKIDKVMLCLDMLGYIAEAATRDPTITDKLLTVDEEGKIALKAFELQRPPKN